MKAADPSLLLEKPPAVPILPNKLMHTENPQQSRPSPESSDHDVELAGRVFKARESLQEEIGKVIVGQREALELMLTSIFARGHALLVGVPGLAKTLLVRTLSDCLSMEFRRIQFTPDLMPSDVTGADILDLDPESGQRHFRFVPGPVFANIVLADEINRTPPRTQAALLQAMAEHEVSAGGKTWPLEPPFHVFATRNPIEQQGTYPLPEAQLDRFLFEISIAYPTREEEMSVVGRTTSPNAQTPKTVLSGPELIEMQDLVLRVPVAPHVIAHAVDLVRQTRPSETEVNEVIEFVDFGAGPRGAQALILAAKARAVLHGRFAAEREDVDALIQPTLQHRLILNFRGASEGVAVQEILDAVAQKLR